MSKDQRMWRLIIFLGWPAVIVVVVLLGWLPVDRALRFGRDAMVASADRAAATMRDLAEGFKADDHYRDFHRSHSASGQ